MTACLSVEKRIQGREDGCVKEGELTTGVKLLRREGILGENGQISLCGGKKMENVNTGVERLVDWMVERWCFCPNPSTLFEL